MVFYQQTLARLPDLANMEVKVRVHESKVKKLKAGQKAEIRIESLANVVLHGTVTNVATLSDSDSPWSRGNVKEYVTTIKIEDLPAESGLLPGMTAAVTVMVNHLPDVLYVPVQAVTQRGKQHVAYVKVGSRIERRDVTVGENNDKYIEIKDGVSEGDVLLMDARARNTAEMKAEEAKNPAATTPREPTAPPAAPPAAPGPPYSPTRRFGFDSLLAFVPRHCAGNKNRGDGMSFHRISHLLRMCLHSLTAHWLRSILTILSIVLGVASVIVMVAVGEAARLQAVKQIEELGATNIIVRSVKPTEESKQNDSDQFSYGVTMDDLERIRGTISTVRSATPMREFRKDVRYLDRKLEARVVSVFPDYEAMNGLKLAKGRFIDALDNERFENVAVLGAKTAEILFPVEDPIGRSVRINENQYFRVIGVTESKASSAGAGSSLNSVDYNNDVYIPFETDRVRFGAVLTYYKAGTFKRERLEVSQLTVIVDKMSNVKATAVVIQDTLDQYHTKQKDTELTVPLDLLERAEKTQQVFTIVLGAIGGVSLVVGGIGIMNIMLATVTERTREIGIRRALGAKRRDIALQFLLETVALSSVGGLLGILGGVVLCAVASHPFFRIGIPTELRLWSIFLAFGVAVGVGLIFGTYPAQRAARMDPIEALRHE
jgi:putative ABC transport system permease protein